MNCEWIETTLGAIVTLQRGHDLPSQRRNAGHIPIMGSGGITGYHDSATTKGPGVVIGRSGVGSMGIVSYIDRDYWALNTTLYVKNFHGKDEKFVYYLLKTINFRQYDTGSAQSSLNRNLIYPHKVFLPKTLAAQRKISSVLTALDDRIALLHQTNITLEAIAQTLFKSWFVDFDPVRAKLEGRILEGMDEATAALFPENFEESESELALIPTGWRVGTLQDLATLNPESWTLKAHPDAIQYIDLANTKNNNISETELFQFGDAPSRARRVLRAGDSIIGTVRPGNRSFAYIYSGANNLTGSTGFAVLRPINQKNAEFIFIAATQNSSIDHLAHVADGGAYPAVRPEVVAGIKVVLPSDAVTDAFHKIVFPIFSLVGENKIQAQTLVSLRDTLLPRLISGQLRLPEAETILEKAIA